MPEQKANHVKNPETEKFDFIISGAGSAGCVLAARLSEASHSVLLLEAGPRDTAYWLRIPMGYSKLVTNPKVNWMTETEPEEQLNGRRMYQPRGKVLGGTSSINGLIYIRGHPDDYDGWAAGGATGWSYEDVLPFFRKAEDQQRGADRYHGVGGPLAVSDQPGRPALAEAIVEAAIAAGLPSNADFNGAQQDGAGFYQTTSRDHRRSSTSRAYLHPALRRRNLKVVTHAHATRVIIEQGRAVGIEYQSRAGLRRASARREVIVSGGTFGSPQLLQLSGIGPAGHLQDMGIPLVRDLPAVGSHLRDHFYTSLSFRCTQRVTMNEIGNSWLRQLGVGLQYVLFKRGVLASNGMHAGIFARSGPDQPRPDLQINTALWSVASRSTSGIRMHPFPGFTMSPVHLAPKSSGTVRLKSSDPFAPPRIRQNFFEARSDIDAMIAGIRLVRRIADQTALAPFVAGEIVPGAIQQSDADLEAFLRAVGIANLHPVGTCRMGSDDGCAVDARLRVRGIDCLRVVDASVMPSLPAGNTNAPTIMIAEKASAMILADAQQGK
jgi:choline dehydrogenase